MRISLTRRSRVAPFLRLFVLALAIVAIAVPNPRRAAAQEADPIAVETPEPSSIVPGEVIVQFRPGTSESTRDQVLAMVNGVFVRSLDLADMVLAKVPVGTEVTAAESIGVDPNVLLAEPNGIVQATVAP